MDRELMELKHEAQPGYKPALVVTIIAALSYLTFIFVAFKGGH